LLKQSQAFEHRQQQQLKKQHTKLMHVSAEKMRSKSISFLHLGQSSFPGTLSQIVSQSQAILE
jgi:hypothetical protein